MNFKTFNRSLIIGTIVIALVLLFVGQNLYQRYGLARPLYHAFNDIQGVESVIVQKPSLGSTVTVLHVTLGDVINLQTTYEQVMMAADHVYGSGRYTVMLEDHRSPDLEAVYHDIHFSIQQGIATGRFAVMAEQVKKMVTMKSTEEQVYVDNRAVYVQLKQNGASLYEVIPRVLKEEQ